MSRSGRPSIAERARTVLGHASPMAVQIGRAEIGTAFTDVVAVEVSAAEEVDVVGVDTDGSLVLMVGMDGALARRVGEHAAPCVVYAALVSPVPGPDRILDRVAVTGHLWLESDVPDAFTVLAHRRAELAVRSEASILLRVMISGVLLNGDPVDLSDYAGAAADPLAAVSHEFVEHLVSGHAAENLQLAHLFDPDVVRGVRADPRRPVRAHLPARQRRLVHPGAARLRRRGAPCRRAAGGHAATAPRRGAGHRVPVRRRSCTTGGRGAVTSIALTLSGRRRCAAFA